MIRALLLLVNKGYDVVLVFTGSGEDLGVLERLAASLGVRQRVAFLGYVPWDAQLAYMARSDVIVTHLVRPEYNGLSQVHLEAALLARPLVTAFTNDLEAEYGSTFFFTKSLEPEDVASLLAYVIEHHGEAAKRARTSAQITESRFSWDRVVDRYLSIYAR
jgi:glycosyltransferase involved in cell wall biosynthesis